MFATINVKTQFNLSAPFGLLQMYNFNYSDDNLPQIGWTVCVLNYEDIWLIVPLLVNLKLPLCSNQTD